MTSTDDSPVPSYPDLLRLEGRGFVVVGAGQGIGRQATHALAQAGAQVFCIGHQAALMSWVRSLAVELGPSGIRANAVAPGVVWTPRVSGMLGDRGRELQAGNAPLRRVAETNDIAAAILFLCSDLASYVTGHTLVVDGGVSAKFPYPMEL